MKMLFFYFQVTSLSESDCMLKFFELLRSHFSFDQETFTVILGTGWSIPVELAIGPTIGKTAQIKYEHILLRSIEYRVCNCICRCIICFA